METKIVGNDYPAVQILLNNGESVFTQSGGMAWMDQGIKMDSNLQGGFLKSLTRSLSGDSLFMATYTATSDNQEVAISSSFPGQLVELDLDGTKKYTCQKSSFLVAQKGVELNTVLTKKMRAGFFGGEGFILQEVSGNGKVFLESSGSVVKRELAAGETLLVDTGNVVAFESNVTYSVEITKGVKNILFGGEGLFLTKLVGPGNVYLQTLTVSDMATRLIPYLPLNNHND